MIPAQVIGRLVPATRVKELDGVPFLIVQPVDETLEPNGTPIVACDAIGANEGEFVYMAQGSEATMPLPEPFNPADVTIIAIIDEVSA